jgi:hypothetical protein
MNQKLDVPRVFERILEIYRDQFTLLVPAALVVFLPAALLSAIALSGGGILLALLAFAISIVATYWYQGMVVEAARDILDGRRDHTLGSLVSSVTPVLGPLVGAGLLAAIATGIGFLLLIVPGLLLLTLWAVLAPVIVIERAGVLPAFGRSQALVKGNFWQVFGVVAVLFLASFILRRLLGAISDSVVLYVIVELIVNLLVAPVLALAAAVLFFELKALRGEPLPEMGAPAAPTGVAPGTPEAPVQPPPAPRPEQPPPAPRPEQPPGPGPDRPA